MKAKYKLGTFVKIAETADVPPHYGAVEAIVQTVDGTKYGITGLDDNVSESEIAAAFREIKPRATKTSKSKRTKTLDKAAA